MHAVLPLYVQFFSRCRSKYNLYLRFRRPASRMNLSRSTFLRLKLTLFRVVASCRAVIRLQEFSTPEVFTSSNLVVHKNPRIGAALGATSTPPRYTLTRPQVHVTTEHITMDELSYAFFKPTHRYTTTHSSHQSNVWTEYRMRKGRTDLHRAWFRQV